MRTMPSSTGLILEKLDGLRTELVDLAFILECRGRLDAADVAMTTSARVAQLRDDLGATARISSPGPAAMAGDGPRVELRPAGVEG